MASFAELSSWTQAIIMLFTVLTVKVSISIFVEHQPMRYFRWYCQMLANKVNKPQNSVAQQKVAGLVALLITLLPIIAILWLFETFIAVTWLWQSLLLYLALDGVNLLAKAKTSAKALVANNQYQAKQTLQNNILRESDKLSPLGLTKASIEMQLLQIGQQLIGVAFYFLLFGPLAALGYRLILEMHYSWNVKQKQFHAFGGHANQVINILQWLPMHVYGITILLSTLGQNFILNWRLVKQHFFKLNNNFILHSLALALGCKLGGVAMYDGEKLRRISFNDQGKQPEISDIIHASSRIKYSLVFIIICLFLTTIAQLSIQR